MDKHVEKETWVYIFYNLKNKNLTLNAVVPAIRVVTALKRA